MRKWKLPQSVFLVATFKAAKLVNPLAAVSPLLLLLIGLWKPWYSCVDFYNYLIPPTINRKCQLGKS